ncbi:asparagine synthase (glutamine-hydrolyzing) [Rhizobium sp. BK316]|uniref:asparagine synthetase B family protein n=1 Tax=Rhizobium sp. BK316 TaxID=2587053 RepID=UPI00184B0F91|nr:asparagine synthase-related protein [Rhizobium sp. BK316]MBB3411928.1 asparagine synthase (glutamine-hydrolyzing) [Rhizobium sp. BK316]
MCGIAAVFSSQNSPSDPRDLEAALLHMLGAIRHRGDAYNFAERLVFDKGAMGTNRLAIVDRDQAKQPIVDPASRRVIVMNGEIYNHRELRIELQSLGYVFRTSSDTEVVLQAFIAWGSLCLQRLDGIFAFVIYDPETGDTFAARDHIGIKPLYYSEGDGLVCFASERKCFLGLAKTTQEVMPGSYWHNGMVARYVTFEAIPNFGMKEAAVIEECKQRMEDAVRKQVATDLPIAVIFSGGLDSTIILHLATKFHKDVTAFSIGTNDSADLAFARRFCAERGIPHVITEFHHGQIGRNIRNSVFNGEFFEPVDISDMLTMAAVYAAVRANGFKVALSGDGSDEIFAGYDLFKTATDPYGLSTYRLNNLYRTDLQRTDRSSMANSIECRVPFLDRAVIELAMSLPFDMKVRNGVEKYVLREAFRSEIPSYMIDRPKIRMPEGIGIHDQIFNALANVQTSDIILPDINIDGPQVRNALKLFLEFGYDAPLERYKKLGTDYFQGGYFKFDELTEQRSA